MLILAAHGTRSAVGVQMIHDLSSAVAGRIGPLRTAFVDVLGPNPAELLAQRRDQFGDATKCFGALQH